MTRRTTHTVKRGPLAPARTDGRPLYFAQPGAGPCALCERMGLTIRHTGMLFMNDPANSPINGDESVYTVCKGHLPANVVIYEPATKRTYDKNGEPVA